MRAYRLILVATVVLITAPAHAQRVRFEAVVSGFDAMCFGIPLTFPPEVVWIGPRQTFFPQVSTIDSPDGRSLLALTGGRIVYLTPDGFGPTFFDDPVRRISDFAVTPGGRAFAWIYTGPSSGLLAVISRDGNLESTYPLTGISVVRASIWDAGDDCTVLFRRSGGGIGRMNACTGAVLPDFTGVPPPFIGDIEPLPNGQFLVARGPDVMIYDAMGMPVRRIATTPTPLENNGGQVAISRDGRSVWYSTSSCSGGGFLLAVSFATGEDLLGEEGWYFVPSIPFSLIIGDPTSDIPTATPTALVFLALTLAFAAVWILRH